MTGFRPQRDALLGQSCFTIDCSRDGERERFAVEIVSLGGAVIGRGPSWNKHL
jgi:hypothetical protein